MSFQYLAALELDGPAVEIRLRLAHVAPVEHFCLPDLAHPEREMDDWMPVPPACFEKQNAGVVVFAQPRMSTQPADPPPTIT